MDCASDLSSIFETNATTNSMQSLGLLSEGTHTSPDNLQISRGFAERVSSELQKHLLLPWITVPQEDGITVMLLSRDVEKSVQRTVFLSFSGIVHVSVHRKPLSGPLLQSILQCDVPRNTESEVQTNWRIFVERALGIIKRLKTYEVCVGVNEPEFKPLWEIDKLGEVDKNPYGEVRYVSTFRPFSCHLLVPTVDSLKKRCVVCIKTKIRFRVKMQRHQSCSVSPSTPNVHLDRNQLLTKVKKQKRSLKDTRYRLVKLRAQLQEAISQYINF